MRRPDPVDRMPLSEAVAGAAALVAFAVSAGRTPAVLALAAAGLLAVFIRGRVPIPMALMLPLSLVLGLVTFANLPELPRQSTMIIPSGYGVGLFVGIVLLAFMVRRNTANERLFAIFLGFVEMMVAGMTTEAVPFAYCVAAQAMCLGLALRRTIPGARPIPLPGMLAFAVLGAVASGTALLLHYADATFNVMVAQVDPPLYTSRAFAPRSTLGSILDLQGSQRVLARIVAPTGAPGWLVGRCYVRYDHHTWEAASGMRYVTPVPAPDIFDGPGNIFPVQPTGPPPGWRPQAVDQVDLAGDLVGNVFTPRDALLVQLPMPYLVEDPCGALYLRPGSVYAGEYRMARGDAPPRTYEDPDLLRACLEVPKAVAVYAGPLARRAARDRAAPLQVIHALTSFFHQHYRYALGYPFHTDDPLQEFLVGHVPAHCEFFASGMTMMLRSRGIPARYVTGFVVHQYNPAGGYFVVKEHDAHAWVEAWVDGVGWVTADPTPPGVVRHPPLPYQNLRDWIDMVVFHYRRLTMVLGTFNPRLWLHYALNALLGTGRWLLERPWRLGILLVLFAVEALFRRPDAPGRLWLRRRGRAGAASSRGRVPDEREQRLTALLARLESALHQRGVARPPALTLLEWAGQVAAEPALENEERALAGRFLQGYSRARYGAEAGEAELEAALERLESRLRKVRAMP